MLRPSLRKGLLVGSSISLAALLTVVKPSPHGLIGLGVGEPQVRTAPGKSASKPRHPLSTLKIFSSTLMKVLEAYVDPTRIDSKKMLYAALESVQFNIPEVLVELKEAQDQVVVVVNDKTKSFSTKDIDAPWRLVAELKKIFSFVETNMNPGAELAEVEYAAINGMLGTLDPHSVLMDPEMAREMDTSTRGDFGGLGIVIGMRDKKLSVIRPMKNTPAWRAGIKADDQIVKINDDITENLTSDEAADRMRGKPGSDVTLWVTRKGTEGLLRFKITRGVIAVPSVTSRLLSSNVGYVRLLQFGGNTASETRSALKDLTKQGAKSFVMDLRGNPGGLLEQAIEISDIFLDHGTIVTTVGGEEREPRRAEDQDDDVKAPLVVLTSPSSASASEIVAGALKNLDRAATIGGTTFGKGSVQILYDNDDGSKLKLTIAQYLTPGDISIQSLGITPDIELQRMFVPEKNQTANDIVHLLPPTQSYREKDLKAHLDSAYAKAAPKPEITLPYLFERPKKKDAGLDPDPLAAPGEEEELLEEDTPDEEFVMDFEIGLARDLVAKVGAPTRKATMKAAKKFLADRRAEEQQKLAQALAKLNVDWTAPNAAQAPQLTAKLAIDKGDMLSAGQEVLLTGTVSNTGQTPAFQVRGRIDSNDDFFRDTEFVFGKVDPGQTKTWTSRVKLPLDALNRLAEIHMAVRDGSGHPFEGGSVKYRIRAAERPVFAYAHQLLDDGNGDGLVEPGEKMRLRVTVKNTGTGISKETSAVLRNASGTDLVMQKGRFEIGELKPGQAKTVEFSFAASPQVASDVVVVEMNVYDFSLRESVSEKLKYPVQKKIPQIAKATGNVEVTRTTDVWEGASVTSARIGKTSAGASFKQLAKVGNFVRVELETGRPGFLAAEAVKAGGATVKPSFDATWQVTPPALVVQVPSYEIKGGTYTLRGNAKDDSHVEDVYVFVSNREAKIENRKVYYRSNRSGGNSNSMDFEAHVPLWPGSNLVSVVSRENDNVKATQFFYLFRSDGVRTAAASE